MQTAKLYRLGQGTVSIFSARSPGGAGRNQDAAALIPAGNDSAVLAVADGVGGLPAGAEAAAMVISALVRRIGPETGPADLREAILGALEHANRRILSRGTGSATTLALVELHAGRMRTYHVGDSMILVMDRRGKVKVETVPHSPVGYAVESGILPESEAMLHGERHLVSNVLGSRDLHISVGVETPLSTQDTLLLATDGLADNVEKERIVELACRGPLDACSRTLTDLARERMGAESGPAKPDDLTLILYRRMPRRRHRNK